eukprot:2158206-Rhodomonas_salina.4
MLWIMVLSGTKNEGCCRNRVWREPGTVTIAVPTIVPSKGYKTLDGTTSLVALLVAAYPMSQNKAPFNLAR